MSTAPTHIYQAYIRAGADQVWQALVDGDMTVQYFYGTRVRSDWDTGAKIIYDNPDGSIAADGEVVAIDAPNRLEMTFHARWDPEIEAEGPVREVWLVEETNGVTSLTVELHDIAAESKTAVDFMSGFPYIFSGLKTLVETGTPLTG